MPESLPPQPVLVSTDGSCLRNPGGAIGWAWVNHQKGFDSGGAASGTNQIAELTAVLRAVEAHPGEAPLLIESDSQYAIRCATEWLAGWKRRNWRTSTGKPVQNLSLVQAIDEAITNRVGPVRFRWVRGHVGHEFNERADRLARLAAQDWAAGRGDVADVFAGLDAPVPGDEPEGGVSDTAYGSVTAADGSATATVKTPAAARKTNRATGKANKAATKTAGVTSNTVRKAAEKPQPHWQALTLFD